MKLPWRYAICFTQLIIGIVVGYIWCQKLISQEKLKVSNTLSVPDPHEANLCIRERADSLRCDEGSVHGNKRQDNGQRYLSCHQVKEVTLEREIGKGAVKQVYLGRWRGMKVAYSSLTHPKHLEDFIHGAEMLQAMQLSELVVRLLGMCLDTNPPTIITEYHELGSADKIDNILAQGDFSDMNTLRTRFQLCLDYARILSFLHSSPVGTRIMCDSNSSHKALSQFLITNDLRLVINDLDALPLVDSANGILAKCGHRQLYGDFVAPEQLWPFPYKDFRDEDMPTYDEKTDIWKVPDITDALLGDVDHSDIIRLHLFKIHRRCKESDPTLRPTAEEIYKVYQEIFDSIVID